MILRLVDPDLGTWRYAYDALGNLTRQTDARGQRVCLYYDSLNRLTGKHYRSDDACPGNPTLAVSYSYDAINPYLGQFGRGYRTGMSDASGNTSWTYDTRGRVAEEWRTVTGAGSFWTRWDYTSADLLASLVYPGGSGGETGETLTYAYHPQLALKSVASSTGYSYVPSISYDAAGRVDVRKLGALLTLQVDYDYFAWNTLTGLGRLKQIQAGPPGDPASLLDLRYFSGTNTPAFDAAGNLLNIYDYKTGSPQTHSFGYDALDRLTSAAADGSTETGDCGIYLLG
jgi:YD repeat-containing protein